MSPEEFQQLPILESSKTAYNEPTGYNELQQALLPYIEYYHQFLWLVFFATAAFLIFRFLFKPLISNGKTSSPEDKYPAINAPGFIQKTHKAYWKIFNIGEIYNDIIVRFFGAAVLLGFLASFRGWENDYTLTTWAEQNGLAICWPFFQNCNDLFFMMGRPHAYVQNTIFMGMLGLIFTAAYGLATRRATLAHICIFILFLWKAYVVSINYRYNANYDYFQTAFAFIFLFVPHKRFFGALSVVLFYYLSTATKIHESWTLGTYFTSMKTGLPVFPKELTLLMTNLVIVMEMVMAWFLFSKNKLIQRTVFVFFFIFHLYSGTLVGYHYPTIVTPSLIIFFGPHFKPFDHIPVNRKAIIGWLFIIFLFACQMISHAIPGDEKMTLEGNFYGLYMFEANHQCFAEARDENGEVIFEHTSKTARNRCDPYQLWFRVYQKECRQNPSKKISVKLLHSINGGPFYEIVNEDDACSLSYKPFGRNEWIKTQDEAPAVGRPRKNIYY